jgi:glycosyltransferase involved in cell wall biosynthesis
VNQQRPLLLHVFSTFAVGGPQMRFATLTAAFGQSYRHLVVAMDGDFASAAQLAPDASVCCQPIDVVKGATVRNVRRFRRQLRTIAPDVLVTYNWGSIEWAMANIPRIARHIHIEDGFGPDEHGGQHSRRVLTRRLVLARSTIVLPSRTLWQIATETWRLDPGRVRYVPNGVDLARFAPVARPAKPDVVIGTVASLRPEKNLARLLRAFRSLALPARLVIVGGGPERAGLEAMAAELGIARRVTFTGPIDDPAPLYRDFDAFALSSDTEQMPLSVIEAMAAGLPVAAVAVGDVPLMVAEANRPFVVPPGDASLGAAIDALVRDAGLRVRLGADNRAKAEREFDQASMVKAYAGVFAGHADRPRNSRNSCGPSSD